MARTAGSLNKSTEQVRRAVSELLQMSAPRMIDWLEIVASGQKTKLPDGSEAWLIKPEPAKAVDLVLKAAEYHIPKLARVESHATNGPEQTHEDWLNGLE